jgi:hypothetical protein
VPASHDLPSAHLVPSPVVLDVMQQALAPVGHPGARERRARRHEGAGGRNRRLRRRCVHHRGSVNEVDMGCTLNWAGACMSQGAPPFAVSAAVPKAQQRPCTPESLAHAIARAAYGPAFQHEDLEGDRSYVVDSQEHAGAERHYFRRRGTRATQLSRDGCTSGMLNDRYKLPEGE